jgi:hypothetical protein
MAPKYLSFRCHGPKLFGPMDHMGQAAWLDHFISLSAHVDLTRRTKCDYVRAQQWRLMTEGADRWKEFMEAMRNYYDSGDAEAGEICYGPEDDAVRIVAFLKEELDARFDAQAKAGLLAAAARSQAEPNWRGDAPPISDESDADPDPGSEAPAAAEAAAADAAAEAATAAAAVATAAADPVAATAADPAAAAVAAADSAAAADPARKKRAAAAAAAAAAAVAAAAAARKKKVDAAAVAAAALAAARQKKADAAAAVAAAAAAAAAAARRPAWTMEHSSWFRLMSETKQTHVPVPPGEPSGHLNPSF